MRIIVAVIVVTTISVTDDVKEKLLKIASELQIRFGRRVNLNQAIRFLLSEREKRPQLLDEACKATPKVEEALKELYMERRLDEKRLERKIGIGHKRTD